VDKKEKRGDMITKFISVALILLFSINCILPAQLSYQNTSTLRAISAGTGTSVSGALQTSMDVDVAARRPKSSSSGDSVVRTQANAPNYITGNLLLRDYARRGTPIVFHGPAWLAWYNKIHRTEFTPEQVYITGDGTRTAAELQTMIIDDLSNNKLKLEVLTHFMDTVVEARAAVQILNILVAEEQSAPYTYTTVFTEATNAPAVEFSRSFGDNLDISNNWVGEDPKEIYMLGSEVDRTTRQELFRQLLKKDPSTKVVYDTLTGLRRVSPEDNAVMATAMSPLDIMCSIIGIDKAMMLFLDDPDFAEELLTWCTDLSIAHVRNQIEAGADLISLLTPGYDLKFFHPVMCIDVIQFFNQVAEAANETGIPIFIHCCGERVIDRDLIQKQQDIVKPLQQGVTPEDRGAFQGYQYGPDTDMLLVHERLAKDSTAVVMGNLHNADIATIVGSDGLEGLSARTKNSLLFIKGVGAVVAYGCDPAWDTPFEAMARSLDDIEVHYGESVSAVERNDKAEKAFLESLTTELDHYANAVGAKSSAPVARALFEALDIVLFYETLATVLGISFDNARRTFPGLLREDGHAQAFQIRSNLEIINLRARRLIRRNHISLEALAAIFFGSVDATKFSKALIANMEGAPNIKGRMQGSFPHLAMMRKSEPGTKASSAGKELSWFSQWQQDLANRSYVREMIAERVGNIPGLVIRHRDVTRALKFMKTHDGFSVAVAQDITKKGLATGKSHVEILPPIKRVGEENLIQDLIPKTSSTGNDQSQARFIIIGLESGDEGITLSSEAKQAIEAFSEAGFKPGERLTDPKSGKNVAQTFTFTGEHLEVDITMRGLDSSTLMIEYAIEGRRPTTFATNRICVSTRGEVLSLFKQSGIAIFDYAATARGNTTFGFYWLDKGVATGTALADAKPLNGKRIALESGSRDQMVATAEELFTRLEGKRVAEIVSNSENSIKIVLEDGEEFTIWQYPQHINVTEKSSSAGTIDPGRISALRKQLNSKIADTRLGAIRALREMGPTVTGKMKRKLVNILSSDPDIIMRRHAAYALGDIGSSASGVVSKLIEALDHSDPWLRVAAALALGKIGPAASSAAPALKRLTSDPHSTVSSNAATALEKIQKASSAGSTGLASVMKYPRYLDGQAADMTIGSSRIHIPWFIPGISTKADADAYYGNLSYRNLGIRLDQETDLAAVLTAKGLRDLEALKSQIADLLILQDSTEGKTLPRINSEFAVHAARQGRAYRMNEFRTPATIRIKHPRARAFRDGHGFLTFMVGKDNRLVPMFIKVDSTGGIIKAIASLAMDLSPDSIEKILTALPSQAVAEKAMWSLYRIQQIAEPWHEQAYKTIKAEADQDLQEAVLAIIAEIDLKEKMPHVEITDRGSMVRLYLVDREHPERTSGIEFARLDAKLSVSPFTNFPYSTRFAKDPNALRDRAFDVLNTFRGYSFWDRLVSPEITKASSAGLLDKSVGELSEILATESQKLSDSTGERVDFELVESALKRLESMGSSVQEAVPYMMQFLHIRQNNLDIKTLAALRKLGVWAHEARNSIADLVLGSDVLDVQREAILTIFGIGVYDAHVTEAIVAARASEDELLSAYAFREPMASIELLERVEHERREKSSSAGSKFDEFKEQILGVQDILLEAGDAGLENLNPALVEQSKRRLRALFDEVRKATQDVLPAEEQSSLIEMLTMQDEILKGATLQQHTVRFPGDATIIIDPEIIPNESQRQAFVAMVENNVSQAAFEASMSALGDDMETLASSTKIMLLSQVDAKALPRNSILVSGSQKIMGVKLLKIELFPDEKGLFPIFHVIDLARGLTILNKGNASELSFIIERIVRNITKGRVSLDSIAPDLKRGNFAIITLAIHLLPETQPIDPDYYDRLQRQAMYAAIAA